MLTYETLCDFFVVSVLFIYIYMYISQVNKKACKSIKILCNIVFVENITLI